MAREDEIMTVDDLDKFLSEEFQVKDEKILDNEVEVEEEVVVEDVESEVEVEEVEEDEESDDTEPDEEESVDDEESEDEESDDDNEDDKEKSTKPTKEEKANHAFAQLRKEASENKRKAEEYDAVLTKLMKESGYKDFDSFKEAVEKQFDEKERKEKGYSEQEYSRLKEIEAREKRLQEKEKVMSEKEYNSKAYAFDQAVRKYSQEYGLGEDGPSRVYQTLEKEGYTAEMLVAQPKPDLLIKGVMADDIARIRAERRQVKKANKTVDTKKITTRSQEDDLASQQEELFKQEMRDYEKRKFGS